MFHRHRCRVRLACVLMPHYHIKSLRGNQQKEKGNFLPFEPLPIRGMMGQKKRLHAVRSSYCRMIDDGAEHRVQSAEIWMLPHRLFFSPQMPDWLCIKLSWHL